jgi:hypothetical protein
MKTMRAAAFGADDEGERGDQELALVEPGP